MEFSKLRERVDCNFKTCKSSPQQSPLSLWYGMLPREDFFGFILIKTWMLNIITNLFDYNLDNYFYKIIDLS
jgi:hypothetical protein